MAEEQKSKYEAFIEFMKEAEQAEALRKNGFNSPDSARVAEAIAKFFASVRETAQKYDPSYTEDKLKNPQYAAEWMMFRELKEKENAHNAFTASRAEITQNAKGLESIVLTLPESKENALETVANAEKEYKSAIELRERARVGAISEQDAKKIVKYVESYVKSHSEGLGEKSKKLAIELARKYALVDNSPVIIAHKLAEDAKEKFNQALTAAGTSTRNYAISKLDAMKPEDASNVIYSAREFEKEQDPEALYAGMIRKSLQNSGQE